MKLATLVLVAGATSSVLAAHSDPVSTHHLEARDPTFGLLDGLLGGLIGGHHGHASARFPSRNWRCNGGGRDGYNYDIHGKPRPAHIPYGWLYFGVEIGWAPSASWSCSSSFEFSAEFWSKAHLITWWSPSRAWKQHHIGIDLGFTAPIHWGLFPAANWQCNGSGRDGLTIDFKGNGRPYGIPSGWLWFGSNIGWAPPRGFEIDAGFQIPSIFLPKAHLCTWWKPSAIWIKHNAGFDFGIGITIPPFWGLPSLPSAGWQCDGSGKDGFEVDHHGNGRPAWVPEGWFWFGVGVGWAPSVSWQCGSSWSIPVQWQSSCGKATWWTPPSSWIIEHQGPHWSFPFHPPPHWDCNCGPSAPSRPPVTVKPTTTHSIKPPHTTSKHTIVKPKPTTTVKPKPTTTTKPKPTTTTKPKPKPSSTGGTGHHNTVTVTVTKTQIVGVPTGGGGCACVDKDPHRLTRRNKSRQSSE
ncbi:uncharacterized protein JCM15063_000135 [Sporobolomyces koalae]|uniref:uncharacterized protein n=1 Tax=Sporobolomyces koalae TaxID=500713 RepID=UPI0031806E38